MTLSFFSRYKALCASGLLALCTSLPMAAADESGPELGYDSSTTDEVALQEPGSPAAAPSAPELPETNVVAEAQPATQPQPNYNNVPGQSILNGTIFSNNSPAGYNAQSSTVGTMINVPTMMYPGTINTITRDVLRDQQVLNMDDAIKDIPSAVKAYGADGVIRADQFFVRGFEVTSQNWRKDGYLDPTYMPRDPANIERIDVLKGPSSTLYGSAQPTGTFNVTTKKAQADPFVTGGFWTGSFGLTRYTVDANTPLNSDGTVLFRINAAYQNNNSFRTSVFNERTFVAPTMTVLLDDDTSLTWGGEYQQDLMRLDQGIPALNGNPFAISNNTFVGDPNGNIANYHSYRSTLTFEKILSDEFTMRVGEMSLWYNTPSSTAFVTGGTTDPNTGLLTSTLLPRDINVASPFMEQNHDILETLGGDFDGRLFHHRMVIGAEQDWFITNHDTFTSTFANPVLPPGFGNFYGQQNFASGASSFPVGPGNPFAGTNIFDNPAFRQNRFGWFGQDIVDVTDQLHVLFGARFDYLKQTYSRSSTSIIPGLPPPFSPSTTGDIHTVDNFHQFSPRAGLTYDIIPDTMSIYGTYAHSFNPSVGVVNFTPVSLQPQIGDIWEGGVKTLLSDNYTLTTAGYWTRQHNVNTELFNPLAGPGQPAFTVSQVGLVRSQGVEASLTGQVTERLSTISNFGYNDTQQRSIDPTIDGKTVRGVPHWTGNVWMKYNVVQNRRHTIGTAIGMNYVGNREADYLSTLRLPAYDIWNMGFYYNRGQVFGSLLWNNVFDKTYAVSSLSQYQVIPGTPSNVIMQMGATY